MVEVAAALIYRGDKFLICQRPACKARGLLWEFAGGKAEEGETLEQALARECMEELRIAVEVGKKFMTVVHRYPDITVRLTVFKATIVSGEPVAIEHAALKWIAPYEIRDYNFCDADTAILKKLSREDKRDKKKKRLGKKGERAAARLLKREGYKILHKNYRTPFCEIDIIAQTGDTVVFCEVKTRSGDGYGSPAEAVDPKKQRLYARAARAYLSGREDITVRFDVIETGKRTEHITNAFFGG